MHARTKWLFIWSADFVQDSFSKDSAYSISIVSLFIDIILVLKYVDRSCFQSPRTWSPSARTRARRSPRFCWSPSLWKICTIVKFFMSQFEINQPTNTTHTSHEFPNIKDFQTISKKLNLTWGLGRRHLRATFLQTPPNHFLWLCLQLSYECDRVYKCLRMSRNVYKWLEMSTND